MMDFQKKAEEVYFILEANVLASDKALIAAALEQAYREGVEDAAQIVGAPWEHLLVAHLLPKSEEVGK